MKNINFASRPYMYFSEHGNVDDDATFITILLVSFNLQCCCLIQSAVCSLQSANVIHRIFNRFLFYKNEGNGENTEKKFWSRFQSVRFKESKM